MSQLRIGSVLRSKINALSLDVQAYQPIGMFKGPRKLDKVPQAGDPWMVTLRRAGMASWADGAFVGRGVGDTLDDAIRQALGAGDLRGAVSRLAGEVDRLTAALRA